MHKNYKQSGRLVYFAEALSIKESHVESVKNKGEKGGKLPVAELVKESNQKLKSNADRINKLPPKFQKLMRNNIARYFVTSVDRFDKNQEKGLSVGKNSEFSKYKTAMLNRLDKIIGKYAPAPSKEDNKAHETETKNAIKDRENFNKSLERAKNSMDKAKGKKITDVQFDASKLNTPDGIKGELNKITSKTQDLQKLGAALNTSIGDFNKSYKSFQKGKKGLGVIIRGLANTFIDDAETKRMESMHSQIKNLLMIKVDEVKTGEKNVKKYGEKVNDAPEKLKEGQIKAREENKKKIEDAKLNQKKNVRSQAIKRRNYKRLKQQHQDLADRKADLDTYEASLHEHASDAAQKEQAAASQIDVKAGKLDQFTKNLDGAIRIIDDALSKPGLSDQQERQLKKQKTILQGHRAIAGGGRQELDTKKGKQEAASQQRSTEVESRLSSVGAGRQNLDTHMTGVVKPALSTIDSSLGILKKAAKANMPIMDQLLEEKATINENIDKIDKIDADVADKVLDATLDNHKLLDGLESQERNIRNTSIDGPNAWDATGGLLFGKIGEGLSMVSYGLDEGIDWVIKKTMEISPAIGVPAAILLNSTVGLLSGAFEGAGELVTGLNTLVGSPWQTLKGLGALAPWADNAGAAWREMGKALISYKEFSEMKIGKGVGKVVFNVLLTLTGGGAALKGLQAGGVAARGAFAIAKKAGNGAILSSAKAGLSFTGRGAVGFTKELATVPGKILGGTGRLLKAPIKMLEKRGMSGLARAEAELADLASDTAKVTEEIGKIKIAGKPASEFPAFKGLSLDDLKALTPDQLVGHGLKTPGDFIAFAKFKAALKTSEKLKKAVKTAKMSRAAARAQQVVDDADAAVLAARTPLDALDINGVAISQMDGFKGKTSRELSRMRPELSPGDYAKFRKYVDRLKAVEKAEDLARVAKNKQAVQTSRQVVSQHKARVTAATSKLDEIKIDDAPISQLDDIKGKSLKELEEMSEAQLAAAGIKSPKEIAAFRKYKETLKVAEDSKESLKVATATRDSAASQVKFDTTTSKLDDIKIGDKSIAQMPDIKGKSFKELDAMVHDELVRYGIKGPEARAAFRKYKKALKASEDAKASLNVAKNKQAVAASQQALTQASDELAAAKAGLGEIKIGNEKVGDMDGIKGKNLDDLEEMTKGDLADIKITSRKAIKAFNKYKEGLAKIKAAKKVVKARGKMTRILTGEAKNFDDYDGIRDIGKTLGLTIEEQFALAKRYMENSGKTIDDILSMEATIGKLVPVKVAGSVDDIIRGSNGVENVMKLLKGKKTFKEMKDVIATIENPTERMLLSKLADDLKGMKDKASVIDEAEKIIILKESMRYLKDYKAALKEGKMGHSVRSSQDIFNLIRGNQRKLVHQTIIDRKFFTGSDHGVTHILEGNMRIADKIFARMGVRISPRKRVLIRQSIIDHDMGYTIKKVLDDADTDSYRNLTKDHPLFSTMWFQRNKATYVKHFGESGYKEMLDAVLDHSNAAKLNLNAKGSKLIANIVAGVDCLGTTADIKMMKLFREPEIMRRLYQLEELRGQLKGVADGSARSKALVRRRNGIFNAMENHIDSMDIDDHLKAGYKRALEKESNFDMTQTGFAAKRDFGSHSAGFEDIDVHTDGSITVDMSVNKNFKLVREMFSDKGDDVSTSALAKTMDDFGLDIDTRGTRVTITRDGKTTTKLYTQQELAKDLEKLELGKAKGGLDSLTIQTPKAKFVFRKNADKGKELARVLRSEKAIKKALEVIGDRSKSKQEMLAAMSDATIKIKTKGYYLNGKPAKVALKKVSDLIGEGKIDRAISLLEDIRFKATTKKP